MSGWRAIFPDQPDAEIVKPYPVLKFPAPAPKPWPDVPLPSPHHVHIEIRLYKAVHIDHEKHTIYYRRHPS